MQLIAARSELHALGYVDGHEGQQSLSIKFYLHPSMQEGNNKGMRRCSAKPAASLPHDAFQACTRLSWAPVKAATLIYHVRAE